MIRIARFAAIAALCGSLVAGCNTGSRSRGTAAAPATNPGGGTGGGTGTGTGGGGTTPPPPPPSSPTLAVSAVTVQNAASGRDVFYKQMGAEVLGFTLAASGGDVAVTSIRVTASGTADESMAVATVQLFEDVNANGAVEAADRPVATVGPAPAPFPANDGAVTFSGTTGPLDTVMSGTTKQYIVSVDLQGNSTPGQTIVLGIAQASDIVTSAAGGTATVTGAPATSAPIALFIGTHLLISEYKVQPTTGEFIEIFNPTARPVDLANYYLTDSTNPGAGRYYYNTPTGQNLAGQGDVNDFHVLFPQGATIAPNEYQVIAIDGEAFVTVFPNVTPNYEIRIDATPDNIPNMVPLAPDTIGSLAGVTNDHEVIILYFWDGQSDLVQDVDYVPYGDLRDAVDKTGVTIGSSTYLADLGVLFGPTQTVSAGSVERIDLEEGGETKTAGNGITGHDETSEFFPGTFRANDPRSGPGPTPGAVNNP